MILSIKKGCFIFLLSFCSISNVFAYYCSTQQKNGFISIGNTMDQVKAACGEPTDITESEAPPSNAISTIQYWMYENIQVNMQQPLTVQGPIRNVQRNLPPVVFQITNNFITAITQGEKSVTQTNQCNGSQSEVRVGDSLDKLITACGQPSFVNTSNQSAAQTPPEKMTTWTYSTGQYAPPITLIFNAQGSLISINGSNEPNT